MLLRVIINEALAASPFFLFTVTLMKSDNNKDSFMKLLLRLKISTNLFIFSILYLIINNSLEAEQTFEYKFLKNDCL